MTLKLKQKAKELCEKDPFTRREKFENAKCTGHFAFAFEENPGKEIT